MSKRIEHVQFVSTFWKGRNFTINSFDIVAVFWPQSRMLLRQSRTLLRHCCCCGRSFINRLRVQEKRKTEQRRNGEKGNGKYMYRKQVMLVLKRVYDFLWFRFYRFRFNSVFHFAIYFFPGFPDFMYAYVMTYVRGNYRWNIDERSHAIHQAVIPRLHRKWLIVGYARTVARGFSTDPEYTRGPQNVTNTWRHSAAS